MRKPLPTRIAAVLVAVAVPSCAQVIGLDQYHDGICEPGQTKNDDCPYTGPEGTQDVGICRSGVRTCAQDGQSWSNCSNEVKPKEHEDCSTPDDDNCNGEVNEVSAGCCTPGDTIACYSGPAGTEGKGICKAGSQKCGSKGTIEGVCSGDVKPKQERCDAPEDENCDGYDCVEWAKLIGDGADQDVRAVAVDTAGNIYVTGQLHGAISISQGDAIQDAGGGDAFVLKLDPVGTPIWGKRFGDPGTQVGTAIAVDSAGNVIFGGTTETSFAVGASSFEQGSFITKLDGTTGAIMWTRSIHGGCATFDDARIAALALTTGNDVAVCGSFCSSMDAGTGAVTSFNGKQDAFVALLHGGSGAGVWAKNFNDQTTSASVSFATSIAVGPDGDLVVTGGFEATVRLSTTFAANSAGGRDAFVAEFRPDGGVDSLKRYGSTGDQVGTSIRVDSTGNYFLLGRFRESIDLGGGPLTADASSDSIFLAEFAKQSILTHAYAWAKAFGAPTALVLPINIDLDSKGEILLSAAFLGDLDLGSGNLSSGTNIDILLAKFDTTGKAMWSRRFDDPLLTGTAIAFAAGPAALLASGETILAGTTPSPINFGTGVLTPAGGSDILIAKFGL